MKKSIFRIFVVGLLIFFAESAFSQDQNQKVSYEISILGLTCDGDAAKIDQMMLSRKGVIASLTKFTSKRLQVTVEDFITLSALRNVIVAAGFEMSEENLIQTFPNE